MTDIDELLRADAQRWNRDRPAIDLDSHIDRACTRTRRGRRHLATILSAAAVAATAAVILSGMLTEHAIRGDHSENRRPGLPAQPTISALGSRLAAMSCLNALRLVDVRITGSTGDHPLPEINYSFQYAGDTPCKIPTWATTAVLRSAAGPIIGHARDVSLVGGPMRLLLTPGTRIAVAIGWRSPCSANSTSKVATIDLRFAPDQPDQSRVLRVPEQYPQHLASCTVIVNGDPIGWIEPIRKIQNR